MSFYVCSYKNCGKTFCRPSKLENHYNLHFGIRLYKCPATGCDKSYSTADHLRRHSKCHIENQPVEKTIYACTHKPCSATFETLWGLQRHENHHTSSFHCEKCNIYFKTSVLRTKHMKRHEIVSKRKCQFCGKDFGGKLKRDLLRHEKKHTYLKCEFCDRTFPSLQLLQRHLVIHESRFECADCGFITSSKSILKDHIRNIHVGFVLPYVCKEDGCSKVFHYKRNYTKHLLRHDEKSQYICPLANCERRFLHNRNYQYHLQLHQRNRIKMVKTREKVDLAKKLVNAVCD